MTEEVIFTAAVAIADPTDRARFLDRVCAQKPELRRDVEALLAAHNSSNPLDHRPAALERTINHEPAVADRNRERIVIDRVGPYKLLEKIGEGGMGEVWVAEQSEPIKRRVALKLIKPGMDSRSVLGRFEAERQALAVMDHPNIAKVLDAGTTADGRPFFVMELVKGTPITEFCDARKLTPTQRLELFLPVCQAIQHAHMKGIIHRDIKPSNVLVALHDETPVPKVIDFGVAKAVGQQLTEKTIYTGFGALVGTPAYMAPEQATFNQLDIDTRADVYALGVLLYELLAGSPPIDAERMRNAALDEVLRIVRDEEPPRPSQRLSTSQTKAGIAAVRGSEPEKLSKFMKGEIDWIVMKALEKDRTRRYETANSFAADVQRYLSGEPVQAVPPSLGYRLKKAYRRNRAAVRIVCGFLGVIIGSAGIAMGLAFQAMRAEAEAKRNADAFFGAMLKADEALQKVEISAFSQRIDSDLAAVSKYPRPHTGLLRLARTLRTMQPQSHRHYRLDGGGEIAFNTNPQYLAELQKLREFITAAVLIGGQEFAPLVPPIAHNGYRIEELHISSDGQHVLSLGTDKTVRLWEVQTGRELAHLQEDRETVRSCGFSPDGRTAFTDDETYSVRLWEVSSGRRLSQKLAFGQSLPLTDRIYREVDIRNSRLLTSTHCLIERTSKTTEMPDRSTYNTVGSVELWDTTTGQRISRFNRSASEADKFQFLDPHWLFCIEGSTAILYSALTGREVARLESTEKVTISDILSSPNGQWIVTKYGDLGFRIWETATWTGTPKKQIGRWVPLRVLNDSTLLMWDFRDGQTCCVYHPHRNENVITLQGHWSSLACQDNTAALDDGRLVDIRTGQILTSASAVIPYSQLAKFAPDGRFVLGVGIDSATGKLLPSTRVWWPQVMISEDKFWWSPQVTGYIPGFGQVAVGINHRAEVRLLPRLDRLAIPPEQLELWLQVSLRGELGQDGVYSQWDEPTWEKKRQELAAISPPYPDVPFPGYVATDKLHWLRAEFQGDWLRNDFENAGKPDSRLQMVLELLRRSKATGDAAEVNRWSRELSARTPQVAPNPRLVK